MADQQSGSPGDSERLELIEVSYGCILEPDLFDRLIDTWDRTYFNEIIAQKLDTQVLGELLDSVEEHFDQALALSQATRKTTEFTTENLVANEYLAAIVFAVNGKTVIHNQAAEAFLRGHLPPTLFDFRFDAESEANLRHSLGQLVTAPQNSGKTIVLRAYFESRDDPFLIALSRINQARAEQTSDALIIARIIEAVWHDELDSVLARLWALSPTEIDIARFILQGAKPAEIAAARSRSIETVRTQIKSLLQKTEARGQADLARRLALMGYLAAGQTGDGARLEDKASEQPKQHLFKLKDGRTLAYSRYGDPNGIPLIYLTTSSSPHETTQLREGLHKAGFAVIAPFRPGFGQSTAVEKSANRLDSFAADCSELLEGLGIGATLVAGHREGGIFACTLSAQLGNRCNGTFLINTGAPITSTQQFDAFPDNAKRSFITALRAPRALAMGYNIAARLFASSKRGERKIMDFFFSGSPIDKATYVDQTLYETTRCNIAYSFENTAEIVADIALWASDWSQDLNKAAATSPVHFIHAEQHDFLYPAAIKAACLHQHNMTFDIIPDCGQTMLYTKTTDVLAALNAHCQRLP